MLDVGRIGAFMTAPRESAPGQPRYLRACSNYRGADVCRRTVTHAVIGRWTSIDTCERCARAIFVEKDVAMVPTPFNLPEPCEVCGRTGAAAARCEFGRQSGPCSCWRGVPCGAKAGAR